jgi:hypothetical protein
MYNQTWSKNTTNRVSLKLAKEKKKKRVDVRGICSQTNKGNGPEGEKKEKKKGLVQAVGSFRVESLPLHPSIDPTDPSLVVSFARSFARLDR